MTLARLQLAVGNSALIHQELPPDGPRRIFAARAPGEAADAVVSRLVIWHPAPPDGPLAGALLDRMASIRALSHAAVVAPLATGTIDDSSWVVEPAPTGITLASRLASHGSLPHSEVVRLLRDTARALAAMHRRGICHGALSVDAIVMRGDGVQLHHLGRRLPGSVAGDLAALGTIGRAAVARQAGSGGPQRVVPAELLAILDRLDAADPAARPATADQVLTALDQFPGGDTSRAHLLFDSRGRAARDPGQRRTAMLLAGVAVLLLVIWLLIRIL